ncbi:hypothetical protein [Pseudaestuariivita sp.]|uniref:hypothetical protein n=1 Tax=Pseudaestuariivita sp. TaxID=2211669 RepID=UPI00405A1048
MTGALRSGFTRRLCLAAAVLCPSGPALAETRQYVCTAVEQCTSAVWCDAHDTSVPLYVDTRAGQMPYRAREDAPRYDMQETTSITHLVGIGGPRDQVGAESLVVFRDMSFVLTSTVQISAGSGPLAVGIIVRGTCERVQS